MKNQARFLLVVLALGALAGFAFAQSMISAKSGLIHYVEGRVLLDGQTVEQKFGNFPQMKENAQLRTEEGRAEVLLTPGVFLRVGENSAFRMVSNQLADTRLEGLGGSLLLECAELLKDNAITLLYKDASISLRKQGLYRLDTEPPQLRVYDGEALVEQGGQSLVLKKGKLLAFNGLFVAERFNPNVGDVLYRWAKRRAEYVAMANVSAAKSIRDSGSRWQISGWRWNPYFGMFTYVPWRGAYNSFWGYRYWSPRTVYVVYAPPIQVSGGGWDAGRSYNPNLGYSTMSHTSAGTSGTLASSSSAPTTTSSAPAASIPRESSSAGGRGR
jgi:hypothetical protein